MRLKVDARTRAALRRLPVINVYSALELVLLAGLAVQCARLVWTVATPVSPVGDWRPAGPAIPASPAAVLRGFDPFYRISGAPTAGPAVVTALQLKLFGTRIDGATGRGSAILAGPDGVQRSVAIGEEIIPGVILKEVAFDHVAIERGGAREDLFLDQSSGEAGAPGVPAAADGADAPLDPRSPAAGSTIARVQAEIGFVPRIDGGRISGLSVRPQGSGAAFRQAGLREGDVVTAIGGRPVTGPADLDAMASDLSGGGTLSLTVERGGTRVPVAIAVTPQ